MKNATEVTGNQNVVLKPCLNGRATGFFFDAKKVYGFSGFKSIETATVWLEKRGFTIYDSLPIGVKEDTVVA